MQAICACKLISTEISVDHLFYYIQGTMMDVGVLRRLLFSLMTSRLVVDTKGLQVKVSPS